MDITTVNGAYTKELKENIDEIAEMVTDPTVSAANMKSRVRAIIEPATIDKTAKPRFLGYLSKCRTKAEILKLCQNAIRKAEHYYR
jgi:exonuclease I